MNSRQALHPNSVHMEESPGSILFNFGMFSLLIARLALYAFKILFVLSLGKRGKY